MEENTPYRMLDPRLTLLINSKTISHEKPWGVLVKGEWQKHLVVILPLTLYTPQKKAFYPDLISLAYVNLVHSAGSAGAVQARWVRFSELENWRVQKTLFHFNQYHRWCLCLSISTWCWSGELWTKFALQPHRGNGGHACRFPECLTCGSSFRDDEFHSTPYEHPSQTQMLNWHL